jgi:DNA ligase (NAD+)
MGRDAFNIEGIGPAILTRLIELGLVSHLADLFRLTTDDLKKLDATKDRLATKLVGAIQTRRVLPLARFVFALGIDFVGQTGARVLAGALGTLDTFLSVTRDDLLRIPQIGEKTADSIVRFLADPSNRDEIDRLRAVVTVLPEEKRTTTGLLKGKTVVVTGTLERFSRSQIEEEIRRRGGKPTGSVSKSTSLLVAGPGAGSKLAKARELSIPVLTEVEFLELLEKGEEI